LRSTNVEADDDHHRRHQEAGGDRHAVKHGIVALGNRGQSPISIAEPWMVEIGSDPILFISPA